MKRRFYLVPVLAFLFGSAFLLQEPPPTQEQSFAATEQFVVVRGSTLWDLASEKCGDARRWQEIYNLNPYLEADGRLSYNNLRRPIVTIYPGEQLVIPTAGCERASAIVALAETDVELPPQTITVAVVPWWAWLLLIIAIAAIAYLLYDRRLLKQVIAGLNEALRKLREQHERYLAGLRWDYERQLAEQRDVLAFTRRRGSLPPLPEGVEDAVLAGPPVRLEGVTEDNREEVLEEAARAAYERLHPGVETDGLTFDRKNTRRVLISSRPGQTFQMTFGDDKSREVTLVREPGWVFDAVIRRGDEVIQELEDVCVVGFCANYFEFRRGWIEGALVEPYEDAAVHSVPDWGTVRAEQVSHRLTLRSAGSGRIIAAIGGDVAIEAESIVLETEGGLKPDGDGLFADGPMHLTPAGKTRVEVETA